MPDGSVVDIPAIVGPRGVGIKSAIMDEAGELTITYTDGRAANIGNIKGETPVKGEDYWTEEDKAEILSDDTFLSKVEFWKPNTEYKVGQDVIAECYFDAYKATVTVMLSCKKDHISSDAPYLNATNDFYECWDSAGMTSAWSFRAVADANSKPIHETYATKNELGDIETALDSIIAIQNQLIGGGSV